MRLNKQEIKWVFCPQLERMIHSEQIHINQLIEIENKATEPVTQVTYARVDSQHRLFMLKEILEDFKSYEG